MIIIDMSAITCRRVAPSVICNFGDAFAHACVFAYMSREPGERFLHITKVLFSNEPYQFICPLKLVATVVCAVETSTPRADLLRHIVIVAVRIDIKKVPTGSPVICVGSVTTVKGCEGTPIIPPSPCHPSYEK